MDPYGAGRDAYDPQFLYMYQYYGQHPYYRDYYRQYMKQHYAQPGEYKPKIDISK